MLRYDNCPGCFCPIDNKTVCGNCGYDVVAAKVPNGALQAFTFLNNKYLLGRTLGKGGFGITYLAKDITNNRICAIKEYMPSEYAARNDNIYSVYPFSDQKAKYVFEHGKEKFIEEAKTLLKLKNNPIVVDILDYFTENNTAYLVMEYLDGQDLRKYARQNGGTVNPDFAKIILVTIASSLMEIHRMGILHRDLSPENIIVNPNQMITLIDFGAARNFVSCQNNGMSILLKPGFAPPEQYNTKGVQGPWTDVYALCATFYSIVSGKPLVDALFRYRGEKQLSLYSLGCPVTKKTSDVIERGMELDYKRRYKDFKAFLDDIDIQYTSQSKQQSINKTAPPANPPASPLANPLANAAAKSAQPSTPPRDMIKKGNSAASTASLIPTVSILTTTGISCKSIVRKNDILKIGRSKQSSNLVLDYDSNISRIHCSVRFDEPNNIFYISDMSVNGTYFEDGRRLEINKEYAVPPGSKFYLASKNNMIITGVEKK